MSASQKSLHEQPGVGSVRLCECGGINLNVGAVTLHLDAAAFLQTALMLRQAADRYVAIKSAANFVAPDLENLNGSLVH